MKHAFEHELHLAIDAVAEAVALCRAVRSQLTTEVLDKKDRSPVTVADFGSQALICRALRNAFPADPIIAEEDSAALAHEENAEILRRVCSQVSAIRKASAPEIRSWIDYGSAEKYAARFWTLDPIDGTKGFLRNEQYAIALALIIEGRPTVSVLGCPNYRGGTLFTAVAGCGTEERTNSGARPKAVRVTKTTDPAAARFCESVESGHSAHDESAAIANSLGISHESIRMDSQCKYAAVACGEADLYMRLPTRADYVERIWDHAAGALLVAEAGGRVTDIHGKDLDFTFGCGLDENRGILATNGPLHDRLVEAIHAIHARS